MPKKKQKKAAPLLASIGVDFHDSSLLETALTHPSYANEKKKKDHNERLEFLGDAVIDFITGDWLFHQFPDMREGQLTQLRAELVRTEMLAQFARACGLGAVVRLGRGEERNGGRERNTLLCDTFEAVLGALFLDQGAGVARAFLLPFLEEALKQTLKRVSTKDPKTLLQEWSQDQEGGHTPTYSTLHSTGPDHNRTFTVEVQIDGVAVGWGNGRSKRRAQQTAAHHALLWLADGYG